VRPVESHDHLVAQGLQQVHILVRERPAVAPVECGQHADHEAGGAQGDTGDGLERQVRYREVAGIGRHVG
jgi:hypothetical protein